LGDSSLINEIENAPFSNQPNLTEKLENQLNAEIKEQARKINELIITIDDTIINDIENKIELGKMQFQDFDLQELYVQGYFPLISLPDIERLEKNYKFLNTITLSQEINNFKSNYGAKNYEQALNSISENTIFRLKNILLEKENIDKGILKIKEDAKNKLNKYIEDNQNTKNIDIKNKINLAKEYYAQEKYLNTIALTSSKLNSEQKSKTKQMVLITLMTLLFLVISKYFITGKKKKNKEDINDRKKHIIRHN